MNDSSNPVLRQGIFRQEGTGAMTVNGTSLKLLLLLAIAFVTALWSWDRAGVVESNAMQLAMLAGVGGMVLSLIISFKPPLARVLALPFAAVEGVLLGAVSAYFEAAYPGIVGSALFGTISIFIAMLALYLFGVIKVTDKFRTVVSTAMLGVFVVYLISFLLSFTSWQIPYIHENGLIGIAFSGIVIIIASLMLAVDFDLITRGAQSGAPKYMEWYGAFALMVTLIWIYIELLRLLSKLRSR